TQPLPFDWMKKKRGRIGDSSAALLRIGVVGGIVIVLAAILGGGYLALRGTGIAILTTPTEIPTRSPTPTATPGLTDTPSPIPKVPFTPTYTPPPSIQQGSFINREPTAIYPNVTGNAIKEAQALIAQGKFDDAIARLEKERQGLVNVKGDPYDIVVYHMA